MNCWKFSLSNPSFGGTTSSGWPRCWRPEATSTAPCRPLSAQAGRLHPRARFQSGQKVSSGRRPSRRGLTAPRYRSRPREHPHRHLPQHHQEVPGHRAAARPAQSFARSTEASVSAPVAGSVPGLDVMVLLSCWGLSARHHRFVDVKLKTRAGNGHPQVSGPPRIAHILSGMGLPLMLC